MAAKTSTALWQQWKSQCWGIDVHISVMVTNSAATALSVATILIVMYTSLLHKDKRRCHCAVSASAISCHRSHTSVHSCYSVVTVIVVAPLSVYITDTLMSLPSLSQCYLGHCCHSTVKYTAVTIGESFVTSLFTFCFISIHLQVEKETR